MQFPFFLAKKRFFAPINYFYGTLIRNFSSDRDWKLGVSQMGFSQCRSISSNHILIRSFIIWVAILLADESMSLQWCHFGAAYAMWIAAEPVRKKYPRRLGLLA
jgi:hypothetical protein